VKTKKEQRIHAFIIIKKLQEVNTMTNSILPNPSKDLKLLQRLESIKEASQREEVLRKS
jgi:hypothetical protein